MAVAFVYLVGKVIDVIFVSNMNIAKRGGVFFYCHWLVVNSTLCNSTCHEFA